MTDRLSLTNALGEVNIGGKAAERIAAEIFDAIHQHLEAALKADVTAVNTALHHAEGR